MMGVAPLQAGSGSFQVMFSVGDHLTGRSVSVVVELRLGPRHCGQFSAFEGARRKRMSRKRAGVVLIKRRIHYSARSVSSSGARVTARTAASEADIPAIGTA